MPAVFLLMKKRFWLVEDGRFQSRPQNPATLPRHLFGLLDYLQGAKRDFKASARFFHYSFAVAITSKAVMAKSAAMYKNGFPQPGLCRRIRQEWKRACALLMPR